MAAIPVTITGTLTYSGLEVGGGPMPGGPPNVIWGPPGPWPTPPIHLPAPQPPLGIWGGAPIPVPSPPIYLPPQPPLSIWGGGNVPYPSLPIAYPPLGLWGGGNVPYPTPPIYLPLPPKPETPPAGGDGSWEYSPIHGWVWVPAGGGGKPQPPNP